MSVATVLNLHHVSRNHGFTRSAETAKRLSAMPGDYAASQGSHIFDSGLANTGGLALAGSDTAWPLLELLSACNDENGDAGQDS